MFPDIFLKWRWNGYLSSALKDIFRKVPSEENRTYENYYKENKFKLQHIKKLLQNQVYVLHPWVAMLLDKKDGNKRPILKPCFYDKIVFKAISLYLSDVLNSKFKEVQSVSFAYQKGRSCRDALLRLKQIHQSQNVLLKIDIKHFFDEIDSKVVMDLLDNTRVEEYVKDLIRSSMHLKIDFSNLSKEEQNSFPRGGIPQGNPVSSILSNLYLWDFDMLAISKGWNMVRYADDMVFSVPTYEEARLILSQVEQYLKDKRRLRIHQLEETNYKTAIFTSLKASPMEYLGVDFDGEKLIPTKDKKQKLLNRIKGIISDTKSSEEDKINKIHKTASQWCGFFAFTDISVSSLQMMSNSINFHIRKNNITMKSINLMQVMDRARKKQRGKYKELLFRTKFDEDYEWLYYYE